MKASTRWLITAAFAVCGALSARAAEVKIIANQSVTTDSISASELNRVRANHCGIELRLHGPPDAFRERFGGGLIHQYSSDAIDDGLQA